MMPVDCFFAWRVAKLAGDNLKMLECATGTYHQLILVSSSYRLQPSTLSIKLQAES